MGTLWLENTLIVMQVKIIQGSACQNHYLLCIVWETVKVPSHFLWCPRNWSRLFSGLDDVVALQIALGSA